MIHREHTQCRCLGYTVGMSSTKEKAATARAVVEVEAQEESVGQSQQDLGSGEVCANLLFGKERHVGHRRILSRVGDRLEG